MHLVHILLPLNDNNGKAFPKKLFRAVADELTETFGGADRPHSRPGRGAVEGGFLRSGEGRDRHLRGDGGGTGRGVVGQVSEEAGEAVQAGEGGRARSGDPGAVTPRSARRYNAVRGWSRQSTRRANPPESWVRHPPPALLFHPASRGNRGRPIRGGRPARPEPLPRSPGGGVRAGARRGPGRAEAVALDVVHLPTDRGAWFQPDGRAVRDQEPGGGRGLPRPPGPRAATGGVRRGGGRPG